MKVKKFNVVRVRFHLKEEHTLVIQGFVCGMSQTADQFKVFLDGESLHYTAEKQEGFEVRRRYHAYDMGIQTEYFLYIELPKDYKNRKKLMLFTGSETEKELSYTIGTPQLCKLQGGVEYCIDSVEKRDGNCRITGWAVSMEPLDITLLGKQFEKKEHYGVTFHKRNDLLVYYREVKELPNCGFEITIFQNKIGELGVQIKAGEKESKYRVPVLLQVSVKEGISNRYIGKGIRFFQRHGLVLALRRIFEIVSSKYFSSTAYEKYQKAEMPDRYHLEKQQRECFLYQPLFSIVVPLYKTPRKYLRQLVASIQAQSYEKWELCLSDGSGADASLAEFLKPLKQKDCRIKVVYSEQELQISENTNAAIAIATGDLIAFVDHDDLLRADALYECVKLVNQKPDTELIYTDEDKRSMDGKHYFQPHFKSDFNIDLLCSMNYFCHLVVVKKSLIERVGLLRGEFDGAQDYDFVLRCVEQTRQIGHIPKALYHWRAHIDSTAENPKSKAYAFEAGKRAIQAHYERIGIPAHVENGEYPGLYRTTYQWEDKPLISILIPNKDHIEDLDNCIKTIQTSSTYRNFEFVIIENNSQKKETAAYYKQLQEQDEKVRVVYWEDEFNYAKINNFGVQYANGEYLLLLNNDTKIRNPDCLWELLGYCMREDVGVVGARLHYEDGTIQHAGVVAGIGGIVGHTFVGSDETDNGYFSRIICAQDYSAVTGACMMTKKSIFQEVGAMTDGLAVAFNDIDYCLKVRESGKLVVYNPYAQLYHYESKSRGLEDTPEKLERFYDEMNFFMKKWAKILEEGDPYYNRNLTLAKADFSLRKF
ncbi:glycosyltransferase [Lachnospiraceae bacterium ZAX-1]